MAFSKRIFGRPKDDATDVAAGDAAPDVAQPEGPADTAADVAAMSAEPAGGEQPTTVMPATEAPAETTSEVQVEPVVSGRRPGFRERGRMRRRLRYLREVRELGYRDLGGLVFDQHRFQRPNEALVQGKVAAIDAIDRESRALSAALEDRSAYNELFVAGVSACQRCGGLHGTDARFCPGCGLAFSGPRFIAGVGAEHQLPGQDTGASPGQAALFDPQRGSDPAAAAPSQEAEQPNAEQQNAEQQNAEQQNAEQQNAEQQNAQQQDPPPPDPLAHAAQTDPAP